MTRTSLAAYQRHSQRACAGLAHAVSEVVEALAAQSRRAPAAPGGRPARNEALEALANHGPAYAAAFASSLASWVAAGAQGRMGLPGSVSIMDEGILQEEIEVARAGRMLADHRAAWLAVQRLEAALRSEGESDAPSCPLAPATIGRALWRAGEQLPVPLVARAEAVRRTLQFLGPRLPALCRDWLAGVEQEARSGAMPDVAHLTQDALRTATRAAAPSAPVRFDVTRPGALLQLLPRSPIATASAPPAQASIHGVIGRLFDEIVLDSGLTPAGALWIAKLRPALEQLAWRDPDLLRSHRHPAWRLVDRVAELFTRDGRVRASGLESQLEAMIDFLSEGREPGRFGQALRGIEQWRAPEVRARLAELEPVLALLRKHAGYEPDIELARRRLARELDTARADRVVRAFVNSVWAVVCVHDMAIGHPRDTGQASAWDVSSDLIWSTSPARSRDDAPALDPLQRSLADQLRAGMQRIALAPDLREAWLERLGAIQAAALRRAPADANVDLPPARHPGCGDSCPAPCETVPASIEASSPPDPAVLLTRADSLDGLRPGDRLSLHTEDGWADMELLWISGNGRILLFGRDGGGAIGIARRMLTLLHREGLVLGPSSISILARAAQRLADQAGS